MSAPSSVSPETLVSVKATHDGNTRRFKIPLKEVGPSVFQGKVRELLGIPETQSTKFERYSDSSASYITLDPENTGVYKQLFRAAKAKLKLRIRVTTTTPDDAPVVHNDASDRVPLPPSYSTANVGFIHPASSSSSSVTAVDPAQLDDAVARAVSSYCSSSDFTTQLRETVREEVEKVEKVVNVKVEKVEKTEKQVPIIDLTEDSEEADDDQVTALRNAGIHNSPFIIYCNSCNIPIIGTHYHCTACDQGDYDLCETCVDKGEICYNNAHRMIMRDIVAGRPVVKSSSAMPKSRICNCCVGRFGDEQCVVCLDCSDFDLCISCLRNGDHGHDPRHAFVRVVSSAFLTGDEMVLLPAGRGVRHAALCDHCDKTIIGVRHKCLDCPDWDYCSDCMKLATDLHPGHRFVPIFTPSAVIPRDRAALLFGVIHSGVYCDGPMCNAYHGACIRGPRFKCAICPDTDFCATCEASPLNKHNASHPLIKLKTPIRSVHVTATDNYNTVMGDAPTPEPKREEVPVATTTNTATQVHTIADVKPTEEFAAPVQSVEKSVAEIEEVEEKAAAINASIPEPLCATFYGDSIADGTSIPAGRDFTQTWYMKNTGVSSWPAGVTVKFVGGDSMFNKSQGDVTVTENEVKPGQFASFSVGLSANCTPDKPYISYWRLTAPDGSRFGDNIWCSINVVDTPSTIPMEPKEEGSHSEACNSESVIVVESVKAESVKAEGVRQEKQDDFEAAIENMTRSQASSEMVFPKLEVESPVHSLEQLPSRAASVHAENTPIPTSPLSSSSHKTFALSENGDIEEEIDISSSESSTGFMTDDEYDVLCASDEEFEDCDRI